MKYLLSILFFFTLYCNSNAQIQKDLVFKSDTLREDVLYNVYLPVNYNSSSVYPVIFYLHWFGGDNNSGNAFMGKIDSLIKIKKFPPCIILAPNAKKSWYINDYKGLYKYSSMFIDEFLPFIQSKYPVSRDSNQRIILGSSMGGFGALRFTMLYPEQFGICVSFMAGMSTKDQIVIDNDEDYVTYHQQLYGKNLKGKDRANDFFVKNNPLYIAQKINSEDLRECKWFIQVCDDDYHSLSNAELHAVFHRNWIQHEFRVSDGVHDGNCVNSSMPDAIDFMKQALEKK